MRRFIYLAVLLSLRNAFLFSIGAWGVAQSETISIIAPVPSGMIGVGITSDGWEFRRTSTPFSVPARDMVRTSQTKSWSTVVAHEKFRLHAFLETNDGLFSRQPDEFEGCNHIEPRASNTGCSSVTHGLVTTICGLAVVIQSLIQCSWNKRLFNSAFRLPRSPSSVNPAHCR